MQTTDIATLDLPYTHLRVVVVGETPTATPEIAAIGRTDILVSRDNFVAATPQGVRFSTFADETIEGLVSCTPLSLAEAVWSPGPPGALVTHGGKAWDHLGRELTRAIPRIDTAQVARKLWPEVQQFDLPHLLRWRGIRLPAPSPRAPPLADSVRGVAAVLANLLETEAETLRDYAIEVDPPVLAATLGVLAPAMAIAAMVAMSRFVTPPLTPVPPPWSAPEAWFALADGELDWLVRQRTEISPLTRASAQLELDRRTARDTDRLLPRPPLRRTGPLARA